MTPIELAAVLERVAYGHALLTTKNLASIRESAAILRRLGDDALAESVWKDPWNNTEHLCNEAVETYRHRVLTPAEPVREPVRWICTGCGAEGDGPPPYSHARAEDDGRGNPVPVECGPCIQIEGAKP